MSYEHRTTILDGISIPRTHDIRDMLWEFVNTYPDAPIIKKAIDADYMDLDALDGDDFWEFLVEQDYLIDCEFLDCYYIGQVLETPEQCEVIDIMMLPNGWLSRASEEFYLFVRRFAEHFNNHQIYSSRFMVNWVI